MDFLKKHRLLLLFAFGIIVLYIFSRLYNILGLPIFTDEAIYVRWAQIAKNDAYWRFISLTDGKQPLFVWVAMILMKVVEEPLLAGRLVSVMAGFASMIGLFFLGRELFKTAWVGLVSSFIYCFYPMALVYDRMALYESLVGAFFVWSLYFIVLLARRVRLDIALILGMILGGGVITKTSGFLSMYLLPFSLILFDWQKKERLKRFLKWLGLAVIAAIATYGGYSILRLSPFFHIIDEKNAIFVYPLKEWITHPFNFFINNLKTFWDWLIAYMTWPVFLLLIGVFFITRSFLREKLILLIWFLIPFVALAIFGKTLYPRFIFFMTLSLLPLASFTLFRIYLALRDVISSVSERSQWDSSSVNRRTRNDRSEGNVRLLFAILCLFIFIFAFRSDYFILNDFANASIPPSDLAQYSNDWPAGGGVKEAINFFREKSKNEKIYIATQGTFGLMPYAFEIYLVQNPNIKIEGFWPIDNTIPQKVIEESKKTPTYFVFYQPCVPCQGKGLAPTSWNSDPVLQVQRGTNNYLTVYKIRSK